MCISDKKLRQMYSCPKQSKALQVSKTTAIAIFGCQGPKKLLRWEKQSSEFLSTAAATCVSSESHKHERGNVGFDLSCLKDIPLLPLHPWGKIVPLCGKRVTLFPFSRKDPSPAGHPGRAAAWTVVLFSQEQDWQGNFSAIFHTTTLNSARL